jgi:hypothetical protein
MTGRPGPAQLHPGRPAAIRYAARHAACRPAGTSSRPESTAAGPARALAGPTRAPCPAVTCPYAGPGPALARAGPGRLRRADSGGPTPAGRLRRADPPGPGPRDRGPGWAIPRPHAVTMTRGPRQVGKCQQDPPLWKAGGGPCGRAAGKDEPWNLQAGPTLIR